ncbi:NPC intracellular cholesterol transporter 1 [Trichonephila clavipes]|nr:NPC intracellular cholesterol transporter 1 [Trichonephila clavipes]
MDFACGSWGSSKCSPENFLDFAGSTPDEGAYSPFRCKYIFHVADIVEVNGQTMYPMKEVHFKLVKLVNPLMVMNELSSQSSSASECAQTNSAQAQDFDRNGYKQVLLA